MRRNLFWGLLLIVIGIVLFVEQVLYIELPIPTIICSFILIYWGISILFRSEKPQINRTEHINHSSSHDSIFTNDEVKASVFQDKFDIIFSSTIVDLTTLPVPNYNKKIKIDCLFAKGLVKIDPDIPAVIKASAVFASQYLPSGASISFGDYTYTTRAYNENQPYYVIKSDVVFGQLDIVEVFIKES